MIEGQQLRGACSPASFNTNHAETKRVVDAFYADEEDTELIDIAILICDSCPVRTECLEIGMSEHYGVWGGKTSTERKSIRKKERQR